MCEILVDRADAMPLVMATIDALCATQTVEGGRVTVVIEVTALPESLVYARIGNFSVTVSKARRS